MMEIMSAKRRVVQSMGKGFFWGVGLAAGLASTMVLAVTVGGAIKTWTAGETLTAADLNGSLNSLATAIDDIQSNFQYVTGFSDWRLNTSVAPAVTWVDVPGRVITYTKTRANSLLRVNYSDTLGRYGSSYTDCEWQILVDDVTMLNFMVGHQGSGVLWNIEHGTHQLIVPQLGLGSHTIKVQNRMNSGQECLSGFTSTVAGFLSVEEI